MSFDLNTYEIGDSLVIVRNPAELRDGWIGVTVSSTDWPGIGICPRFRGPDDMVLLAEFLKGEGKREQRLAWLNRIEVLAMGCPPEFLGAVLDKIHQLRAEREGVSA